MVCPFPAILPRMVWISSEGLSNSPSTMKFQGILGQKSGRNLGIFPS